MFSCGVDFGLPRSFLLPRCTMTWMNAGSSFSFSASLSSCSVSAVRTVLYPIASAILWMSISLETVGWPPTESWTPLFIMMWIMFFGAWVATVDIPPMCIMAAPSPSMHTILLSGRFNAIPNAICEEWPMEPTVRKSLSCGSFLASLISYSSLDAMPVVETKRASPMHSEIIPMASSRDMG